MWLCVNTYCSGLSFLCIVSEFGLIYGSPSKLNIFVYMFTSRPRLPWGGSGCYEHELWREQPPQCPICASSRSSFINSDHSNTARGKGQSSQCSREVTWHMMVDVFLWRRRYEDGQVAHRSPCNVWGFEGDVKMKFGKSFRNQSWSKEWFTRFNAIWYNLFSICLQVHDF